MDLRPLPDRGPVPEKRKMLFVGGPWHGQMRWTDQARLVVPAHQEISYTVGAVRELLSPLDIPGLMPVHEYDRLKLSYRAGRDQNRITYVMSCVGREPDMYWVVSAALIAAGLSYSWENGQVRRHRG